MNVSLFIARKYFFSKKKKNFINVISIISMLVVGMGTMSLVIVLSVFNGLEGLLRSLYGNFDPHIVVRPVTGKSFEFVQATREHLSQIVGVAGITEVIEDNVLIKYKNAQRVVRMKGVSDDFIREGRLDKSMAYGTARLNGNGGIQHAIVGRGIQYDLSINPQNDFYTLQIYYPKNIKPGITDPTSMYRLQHAMPVGVFAIEKYYDENYVFVSLDFAQSLLEYGNKRTSLEITLADENQQQALRRNIQDLLGDQFTVLLGEELHEDLYKILKIEKLFVFIIFSLIIGIASINIYFSLTMLAIDKRRDVAILNALGANNQTIRKIFLMEGGLVAWVGAGVGLVLGLLICYVQQEYGLISMGMQSTVMDAYPVKVQFWDVFITCICIIVITMLASVQPARLAVKRISIKDL